MGNLIASFDWSKTSLGDPENWPVSLLTCLGIMLKNKIAMYLIWGPDQIQFYNDSYIPIIGKQHPSALGNNPSVTWAEIYDQMKPLLDYVLDGKTLHSENMPYTTNVNDIPEERFYTFTYVPVQNETRIIEGVFVTVIETTEEMNRKKALKESEKNFRNYQEMSPIPFMSLTKDWIIDYMNPIALKNSTFTKEDLIGKSYFEAFGLDTTSIFYKENLRAMNGESVDYEGYYEQSDSWYRLFAYPLAPGLGIVFQDITESKKLQDKLKSAVDARDRLLSIASHELNTPLASLKLHTQMMLRKLEKGIEEKRLKKFFDETDIQISRLGRLVEDMLDLSHIREGKFSLNSQSGDFKKLVIDIIERLAPNYESLGLKAPEISIEGHDFMCFTDFNRADQVVTNLLTNALKYGEGKAVDVKIYGQGESVLLSVEDHGRGISESDQKRIFEQFYRGEHPTGEGLGLGLYITKEIVNTLGGKISFKSILGKGSTFRFELPKEGKSP